MKKMLPVLFFAGLLTGCSKTNEPSDVISFNSLLSGLTNVASFAVTPVGTPGLITTYDRTGGNDDFARLETLKQDDLYVLADLKGPGCVTRMWMTSIEADEWLFFFDGEKEPRIRASHEDVFGRQEPFLPPLADKVSGGYYCYLPIPYAHSLKIALRWTNPRKDARPYFQCQYQTYSNSLGAESFPAQLTAEQKQTLKAAREGWQGCKDWPVGATGAAATSSRLELAPGATGQVALETNAPSCITLLRIRPALDTAGDAVSRAAMLRALVLRIYWDGAASPSVEVPLGDFFCSGLRLREHASLPLAIRDGAMYSRFPMPFKQKARMEIENSSRFPMVVDVGTTVEPYTGPAPNYFHASWNSQSSGGQPFRLLRAEGRGYLAGCYVIQMGFDGSWNMFEGDDILWLNGEAQPSFHGTGLEDHFNGAWYYSGLFHLPQHGLVEKGAIRSSQYRFYLEDRVRFDNGALFTFEFGDRNTGRGYMSGTAYWYQPEPHAVGARVPVLAARFPAPDPLEPTGIMSALFELERLGRFAEASEYCMEYIGRYPASPWCDLMKLRAVAGNERVAGFEAVRPELEALAAGTNAEVVAQARRLLGFHTSPTNALLGCHGMGRHRVYLDGVPVGEAEDPTALQVWPVTLTPGEHELAVELAPTRPHGQLSVYLRMHTTNITSDPLWEYARPRPEGWPKTDAAGTVWKPVEESKFMMPSMTYWQFVPNGFVGMQCGTELVRPWAGWFEGRETAYLRRRFIVPAISQSPAGGPVTP